MLVTMKEILEVAQRNKFAVPAFNTSSSMILKGVMEACEEKLAPVIIAIHPDELSFTNESFVAAVREEAHKASIPVCIHLDHGSSFQQVVRAIACGFTSVMIDSSTYSFEQNIEITQKIVELAHAAGVSVEAELGTIGATGNGGEAGTEDIIFTNPNDVETFVTATKVDTLAIAIGTAHGIYPKDKRPKLRLDLLKEITSRTSIPLVLHGGSDNPDNEIAEAVELGVSKINISSDIKKAFYNKCREVLQDLSLREPNAIYPPCIESMKQVIYQKIDLFKDANRAHLYR
ncbi:fructose-bisphosphate aldolase, class II [Sphaerochaeta associata]|uniref:Ketose-bisphosphate aldolase n=1 Tax=Sphaerochaeta associata TaxID=1129264 RepID=A0ABY4DAV8_9SPIR|nr:ketose-bisphosphate aldolase [Sphaerochaeta associata]UOM51115.1 ketose-bisphosphate aldolase [Sphaerochaeta associata]SMP65924.1 fructose-bisphosphate aldolase, class II [Sphaerochaeta associata]